MIVEFAEGVMRNGLRLLGIVFWTVLLLGCGGDDNDSSSGGGPAINSVVFSDPWPTDINAVYSVASAESSGDHEIAPGGAPPYSTPVDYPPVDLIGLSMGVEGGFLYIRFDFAGVIPTATNPVAESGEVEAQTVLGQGISVNFNSDGDLNTGAGGEGIHGIDIFFAFSLEYGRPPYVYADYGFPDGDIHHPLGHADGELGEGGPGYDYVLLRFLIADFADHFPKGETLDYGGWSEAESDLYHHFAFDPMMPGSFYMQ
ncbi:MAG: hypothetical protein KZQ95_17085 [Candidatus Thiodiazotropha sp. (ex Epidulcina cf. delphinae)]|nr:hypothetical protein [Candidatus Thiodiazotropha sp. (ex Epidulcina cf. delphinae)]